MSPVERRKEAYHRLDALTSELRALRTDTRYAMFDRACTVKRRMRKDRDDIVTIACWNDSDDNPKIVTVRTIELPSADTCKKLSLQLRFWLERGGPIEIGLPTFPGYENIDAWSG